jgi:hypothetical protein
MTIEGMEWKPYEIHSESSLYSIRRNSKLSIRNMYTDPVFIISIDRPQRN